MLMQLAELLSWQSYLLVLSHQPWSPVQYRHQQHFEYTKLGLKCRRIQVLKAVKLVQLAKLQLWQPSPLLRSHRPW